MGRWRLGFPVESAITPEIRTCLLDPDNVVDQNY
jgi:hypothetical protein